MKKMLLFVTILLVLSLQNTVSAENLLFEPTQRPDAAYRLYRTTNVWTFIKLDTRDGRMWQLQFDVESDNRGTVILNNQPLIDAKNRILGRFTLYPTSNIYNFILLDQVDGRAWQVQWSTETNARLIIQIK